MPPRGSLEIAAFLAVFARAIGISCSCRKTGFGDVAILFRVEPCCDRKNPSHRNKVGFIHVSALYSLGCALDKSPRASGCSLVGPIHELVEDFTMTVTASAKLLEQGIAIARDGHRTLAQMYLRRAADESPGDTNFWLWMAWLAESPAEMVYCLESLLAEQPDHPLAQDGLRWARGLADAIAHHVPGPEFSRPQDTTDFEWTSIVDASSADSGGCELHAVETLGVAIAAVEELVLDIAPPPYHEDAYDELPSQPTAAPLPVDPVPADPALTEAPLADVPPPEASLPESSLPEASLAPPELPDAPLVDESWVDADLPLADESSVNEATINKFQEHAPLADESLADADLSLEFPVSESPVNEPQEHVPLVGESLADVDLSLADESRTNEFPDESPLAELLLGDSLPASPVENAVTEPPELPEKMLEYPQSLTLGDEKADGDTQFEAVSDVPIDAVQKEPVVQLSLAEQAEPERAPGESQPAAIDQLLEPATVEPPAQPAPQELQILDVPQDAPVTDCAAEEAIENGNPVTPQDAPVVDFVVEGNGPAILVVDDSLTIRKLVTMTLSKHGYRVFSAADGVAAIEAIHACEPALIILDIDTPRLDGYKFCNLVKKGKTTKGIKVVMLSGKDGIFDKFRRRMNGCTDTLTKPFSPETLLSMVEKLVVSPSQHPVSGQVDGSLPLVASLSTNDEADNSGEPCVRRTAEPTSDGLDNHSILHLSRLAHQVSLLHNPTTAEGCQQALQTARTILADTLEFLQATERQELLDRNRDDMCRILEEIKKVDQLLEWPSLWGLLSLRTSAEQTQQQAFEALGVGYATLLESLLTQIGATFHDGSHAVEWEASVRPLLVDFKRLW
jgi:twitching motility two-component system response regulator PilG